MKGPLFISVVAAVLAIAGFFVGPTAKEVVIGAMPGNIFQQDSVVIGNAETFYAKGSMKSATTTVCALKSPAATSTLESAGALFTVSSTTASVVTFAKAANAFATTTSLGRHAVAANAQAMIQASSTETVGLNDATVFGPNQWLVIGMEGGTGTFSPTGSCRATWEAY